MAETKVTNRAILDALLELGIDPAVVAAIPDRGAQSSTFRSAVMRALGGGVSGADKIFDRAKATAAWRPDPEAEPMDNFVEALRVRGIDIPANLSKIADRARKLAGSRSGIRPSGTPFEDVDFYNAAAEILGADNPVVTSALRATGVTRPPAPPGERLGPSVPPAAPGRPGGPRMQIKGPAKPEAGLRPGTGMLPAATSGSGTGGLAAPGGGGVGGLGGGGYSPAATPPSVPLTPAALRAQIEASYGWAAALADEPEVAKILNDYAANTISLDEVERRFRGSGFYQRTTEGERNWKILERTDPAEAAKSRAAQFDNLKGMAAKAGVAVDERRLALLTDLTLRYGWTDTQVARYLAAEFKYDPSGQRAGITQTLKTKVRDYVVPMSDQVLTSWGQAILSGTKSEEDFDLYLRSQAKLMFPGIAGALDDPNLTTRDYLDPYAEVTAKTLGINATDIDWTDPKWMRAVNQVDDKGNRTVMSVPDWQRTLIADPTFSYDQTANGKAAKADLGRGLLQTLGFTASTLGR